MALCVDREIWPAIRRIGEIKGRIASLEDIRLRLIEMGDQAAADAMIVQIDRLRTRLDHQRDVLVAVRARLARSSVRSPQPKPLLSTTSGWR